MSNTKHTPGPWLESNSPVTKAKPSGRWFKSVKNTRSIGGKIIGNGYGDTKEEAEANAKLISAAPELLDNEKTNLSTVASLIHGIKSGTMDNDFILQTLYNMKRDTEAAIKKATE